MRVGFSILFALAGIFFCLTASYLGYINLSGGVNMTLLSVTLAMLVAGLGFGAFGVGLSNDLI